MSADSDQVLDGRMWRIREWFPKLSDEVSGKLKAFHYELIHFNGRINLISPRTERFADLIHFADSIMAAEVILAHTNKPEIYDIGSGNGIPGLVMAVLAPERKFVLIDKDARKIEFLKHCIARLSLKNASALQTRFEDIPDGAVTCAVSRGFASLSKALISARKACGLGTDYYHFKADSWVREVAEIPTQVCSLWSPELIKEYTLPDNGPKLAIVLTKKIA